MRRSRSIIALVSILLLALSLAAWGVDYRLSNRVTVVNHSGQTITQFTVEVWGDTYTGTELADGKSAAIRIGGRNSDSSYHVFGVFADGTTFDHRFGYVTGGFGGERATVTVYPAGRVEGTQP